MFQKLPVLFAFYSVRIAFCYLNWCCKVVEVCPQSLRIGVGQRIGVTILVEVPCVWSGVLDVLILVRA